MNANKNFLYFFKCNKKHNVCKSFVRQYVSIAVGSMNATVFVNDQNTKKPSFFLLIGLKRQTAEKNNW